MAAELVIETGALSAEHILNVLARLSGAVAPETVASCLQLKEFPVADTGRYDSLRIAVMAEIDHAS